MLKFIIQFGFGQMIQWLILLSIENGVWEIWAKSWRCCLCGLQFRSPWHRKLSTIFCWLTFSWWTKCVALVKLLDFTVHSVIACAQYIWFDYIATSTTVDCINFSPLAHSLSLSFCVVCVSCSRKCQHTQFSFDINFFTNSIYGSGRNYECIFFENYIKWKF